MTLTQRPLQMCLLPFPRPSINASQYHILLINYIYSHVLPITGNCSMSALFQHVNNRQQLEGNNGEFLSLGLECFYSTQRRNSGPLIKILLHLPFPAPQSAPVKLMLHLSLHSLLLPAASTVTAVASCCNNSAL